MNACAFALADMFTMAPTQAQADGWWCESLSLYPTITCDTIDDNVNAARSFFFSRLTSFALAASHTFYARIFSVARSCSGSHPTIFLFNENCLFLLPHMCAYWTVKQIFAACFPSIFFSLARSPSLRLRFPFSIRGAFSWLTDCVDRRRIVWQMFAYNGCKQKTYTLILSRMRVMCMRMLRDAVCGLYCVECQRFIRFTLWFSFILTSIRY